MIPPALDNSKRPVCPICNQQLELWETKGYAFTSLYWFCECLLELESLVIKDQINPDVVQWEE